MYIYIYIEREREDENETFKNIVFSDKVLFLVSLDWPKFTNFDVPHETMNPHPLNSIK